MKQIRALISEKVAEKNLTGRFGTWAVSIHIVMIEAAVKIAVAAVHGKMKITDMAKVKAFLDETGDIDVQIELFNNHDNFMLVIAPNLPL